jgi:phenylacetate-coenzyme A ligase PaaK-like adenylate-forming protein
MSTATSDGATAARPRLITAEELIAHDRWSRDELLAYQRERARELISHAVSRSAYYREVLGRDALDPKVRLGDLPTLSKATLMEQFDKVLADSRLRLAMLEAHAAGAEPGAPMAGALGAGAYHVFCTSGTSGRRGVFPQTRAEFAQWLEAAWRVWARIALPRQARTIGIGAPTPLHITQKLFAAFGGFGDGRPRLTASTPLPKILEALARDRPEALFTIPSLAGVLAQQQLDGQLAIAPNRVVLAGEVLGEELIARIAQAWAVTPFQVYASTEALMLASESSDRVGLHISEDLVVLEVVDEHNRPVPPGAPGHKVLITSLVGRTLPLIRYELADTITLAASPDPSGRPYRRIERVEGRNDDVLRLPAAIGGGEAIILPHRLRALFAPLADVTQYQIVHEPQRLLIRLVLRPDASSDTPARIIAGIRAALQDAGAIAPPIETEQVAEIEREPGGAKLKLVKTVEPQPPAG